MIEILESNINVYFYYPPEFGWKYNKDYGGYYYLTKTAITILSGNKLAPGSNNKVWNTNGNWFSQTCQFEVTEEADAISGANQYDRFLVLLEKIT